jgi:hypothetical protein
MFFAVICWQFIDVGLRRADECSHSFVAMYLNRAKLTPVLSPLESKNDTELLESIHNLALIARKYLRLRFPITMRFWNMNS